MDRGWEVWIVGERDVEPGMKLFWSDVVRGEHLCGIRDDGGIVVGSGERWECGGVTRLGSMWGGGGPSDPNCIDKKYLVAACLSCSLSSAVWRLKQKGLYVDSSSIEINYDLLIGFIG